MRTERFLPAQIWTIAQAETGSAVFIRPEGGNVALPVYVSESDVQSLLVEMTHILAPRPMVHELLLSVISSLQGKLDRVEIYGIRRGSYLCRLVLKQHGREIRLESRPTDVLCLAARTECPVFVDDEVLTRNAVPVDRVTALQESHDIARSEASERDQIMRDLQESIEKEEYERAAELRDRLNVLTRNRIDEH